MLTFNAPKQTSLFEIYSELSTLSHDKPHAFLELLKEHFNLSAFIPEPFRTKYYNWLGRDRSITLESTLAALLFMHFLNIPTTALLCTFLTFSSELRDFCLLGQVPNESHFSRFKTQFSEEISLLLDSLSSYATKICAEISDSLPKNHALKDAHKKLIYDTSGTEPRVKENNPKFIQSEIRRYKTYAKTVNNENFNPYAAAYANLPKESSINPNIKLDYLNGHYGYFYKFGALINGFGVPLHIRFYDSKEFTSALPADINLSDPEEAKNKSDNASLRPILQSFAKHHDISQFNVFLADSEFDSYDNFSLLKTLHFEKALIPLNPRNSDTANTDKLPIPYDKNGWPLCPVTKEPMISEGPCRSEGRSLRFKFRCHKSGFTKKGKRVCTCEHPCTDAPSGRMHYIYPDKDFRMYPGIVRGSNEWDTEYSLRAGIERTFSSLKANECVSYPRTLNLASIRADVHLAACTQVITLLLAYSIKKPEFIRSISKVLKFVS
jgi:hypothetical protein